MSNTSFYKNFCDHLDFEPTTDQVSFIHVMQQFLNSTQKKKMFVLRGYAGTGKTTMVSGLIKTLDQLKLKTFMMAPTGRAAKVLTSYSGREAATIHRKIYWQKSGRGGIYFVRQRNLHKNTLFIVDEASMIGDSGGGGGSFLSKSKSLLDDLLEYVYEGEGCSVMFVGDVAQLPPVGLLVSPALNYERLEMDFNAEVFHIELKEVVRQAEASGILENATNIRALAVGEYQGLPKFETEGFDDFFSINGEVLEDEINSNYGKYGIDNCLIITRSNKRANLFNQHVRSRILWLEEKISSGDLMMVVKNNYFWVATDHNSFIANGDILQIERVNYIENRFGFEFADVEVRLKDYTHLPEFNVKLLLDSINADGPSISREDNFRLYAEVLNSYENVRSETKKRELIKKDPYYNALQVKFAYAVTCHKSQGGQWDTIFVEQGYITDEMVDQEWSRWLYTAITRAKERLYLVNFHPKFISGSDYE